MWTIPAQPTQRCHVLRSWMVKALTSSHLTKWLVIRIQWVPRGCLTSSLEAAGLDRKGQCRRHLGWTVSANPLSNRTMRRDHQDSQHFVFFTLFKAAADRKFSKLYNVKNPPQKDLTLVNTFLDYEATRENDFVMVLWHKDNVGTWREHRQATNSR